MTKSRQPSDPDDRTVPGQYCGTLAPGYYCRAWNPRRQKYCRARAGARTDHPGTGRCWIHGGTTPVQHGQHRRYANVLTARVRDLIAEHAADPNPLDLLPELATARALLQDYLERRAEDEDAEALAEGVRLVERIARIVEGIERAKAQTSITVKELDLLMLNMGRVVRQHVSDDALCQRILDGWLALRV